MYSIYRITVLGKCLIHLHIVTYNENSTKEKTQEGMRKSQYKCYLILIEKKKTLKGMLYFTLLRHYYTGCPQTLELATTIKGKESWYVQQEQYL